MRNTIFLHLLCTLILLSSLLASARAALDANLLSITKIHFEKGSTKVSSDYLPVLYAHAAFLRNHPQTTIDLAGHVDRAQTGSDEYAITLGEALAKRVEGFLRDEGVKSNQLVAFSYGANKPVCEDSTPECREMNRRVEIIYHFAEERSNSIIQSTEANQ